MEKKGKKVRRQEGNNQAFQTQAISQADHQQPQTHVALPDEENVKRARDWVIENKNKQAGRCKEESICLLVIAIIIRQRESQIRNHCPNNPRPPANRWISGCSWRNRGLPAAWR